MTTNIPPGVKLCKYGCGKYVYWNESIKGKLKWVEYDSGSLNIIHNYPRCADLLKEQGKDLSILKKK
ncbi:MAG: hypothetical protein R2685_08065 [Candidatus Nitrosocosmicus sp.]|nr:hypothetical protein [Candidatus Nitrosocosmicus sp.]